jgi:hypothetical protein
MVIRMAKDFLNGPYSDHSASLMEFDANEIALKPIPGLATFSFIDKYQQQLREKMK